MFSFREINKIIHDMLFLMDKGMDLLSEKRNLLLAQNKWQKAIICRIMSTHNKISGCNMIKSIFCRNIYFVVVFLFIKFNKIREEYVVCKGHAKEEFF